MEYLKPLEFFRVEKMTLKESLMTIKDFRIDRCKKHNLCDILMIVLIGYLTGCKDIEEICFSAEVCEEKLRKYLELTNGIPSTDTILRVLAGIYGKELEKALAAYTRETFGSLILVSAFASPMGICFGQVKTEEYIQSVADKINKRRERLSVGKHHLRFSVQNRCTWLENSQFQYKYYTIPPSSYQVYYFCNYSDTYAFNFS